MKEPVPGETWFSLSATMESVVLSRGEALWSFHSVMSADVAVMQVLFRQPYCWDLMGVDSLSCLSLTLSQSRCSGPLTLKTFCTRLGDFPWALGLGLCCRCTVGDGHPTVTCSLHFDHFWISGRVSVWCKKTLLWWGGRATFIFGDKDSYLECS